MPDFRACYYGPCAYGDQIEPGDVVEYGTAGRIGHVDCPARQRLIDAAIGIAGEQLADLWDVLFPGTGDVIRHAFTSGWFNIEEPKRVSA